MRRATIATSIATPSRPTVRVRTMSMPPSRSKREGKQSLARERIPSPALAGEGQGGGLAEPDCSKTNRPLSNSPRFAGERADRALPPSRALCQTDADFSGAWRDGGAGGFQTRADRAGAAVSCGRAGKTPPCRRSPKNTTIWRPSRRLSRTPRRSARRCGSPISSAVLYRHRRQRGEARGFAARKSRRASLSQHQAAADRLFCSGPILFVIVHAYVMAHFVLLSQKASPFTRS